MCLQPTDTDSVAIVVGGGRINVVTPAGVRRRCDRVVDVLTAGGRVTRTRRGTFINVCNILDFGSIDNYR